MCHPVQKAAREPGFGPLDQLGLGGAVLSVARGADACLELTDALGDSGESPLIAVRLSQDGRTLWINNQLDELLGFDISVRTADGEISPASSCPVASHSVVELDFDEPVVNASLTRFRFGDPDCNRP